ncbi:hypothetical protein EH165_07390 [Nakamurella antarctica]|uniref:Xaa-Pro aminopeptidase n=1 Tax=Nakamurella antarctica TaxID=1902245 RepID=A0A3G8ZL00_9ACTN|nr:M24 family metallopeptidase [Nakamurella antarctica]AZI57989.1 hypothetical protein EH165_07390 [Nakamurella antarctica]
MSNFAKIPAPAISVGAEPAAITNSEYLLRLVAAQDKLRSAELDFLLVYADREHFADLVHLTGVDPRFEEAIYVLSPDGLGNLLLGNENLKLWPAREIGIPVHLYQELSPLGQIRSSPLQLTDLLRTAGIETGSRVGVAGGKEFTAGFVQDPVHALSAPAYLVDALRQVVGLTGSVVNAEHIFKHPTSGLRTVSSAHQIAHFEYAAAVASHSVMTALGHLHPGIAANTLADTLFDHGIPLSCHTMVNFGDRQGLYSPSANVAQLGDAFAIAQGLRGGLTCRAGIIARGPEDLVGPAREGFPQLALNYFDVLIAWYEAATVGAATGDIFAAAESKRDRTVFEFALNPGHLLHLEEWSQSTFEQASPVRLQSGSMVQCDIIPVSTTPGLHVNVEDGVALADGALRAELANDYPELWDRVENRRRYLSDVIGVTLDESVLPMSTMPLWFTPYVMDAQLGMTK